jgi:hypothetical protein
MPKLTNRFVDTLRPEAKDVFAWARSYIYQSDLRM